MRVRFSYLAVFLGAAALVAADASAQGAAANINPETIQSAIAENPNFDVAALWRSLRIPLELDTVYGKLTDAAPPRAAVSFDRCANSCLAELTRANLDADPIEEAVLAIYQESKACRFLVFKPTASASGQVQWRFLGFADHDALGQYSPEYRVAFMGRRYFVVSAPGVHDTGGWVRYERWYEVGPSGLREALTIPADGIECVDARSLCRAFGSTVAGSRNGPRGEELTVAFTVRYWGDQFLLDEKENEDLPLFTRTQRGVYVRTAGADRFALAPLDSTIESLEIQSVFLPGGLTCQDFVVYNTDNLQQIASSPTAAPKAWLARFLDRCSPSPQLTQLRQILGR
ncbi:MAG TPA: hypothetical protein VJP86_10825 [Vicinamibacterales bacterium]|jgi:hypothetical protein|nr:hypothetical protein [Vicinamibacterales bacterium]